MSFTSLSGARIPHGAMPPPPDLLLHFDGSVVDATGNFTLVVGGTTGSGFTAHTNTPPTYEASPDPLFGQRAIVAGNGGCWVTQTGLGIAGSSAWSMCGKNTLPVGSTGGVLIGKAFLESQPTLEPGEPFFEWGLRLVTAGGASDGIDLSIDWNGGGAGRVETQTLPLNPSDTAFWWALCNDDDGLRFYCNGVLVATKQAVHLHATPPVATVAKVCVFQALSGFSGSDPNWSNGFIGKTDELAVWASFARYTDATHAIPPRPFTV